MIINDGSTDNSLDVINSLKSDKLIIISQDNSGVSATRNRAMRYAQEKGYDAIAFLDADDYWCDNHLFNLSSLFKNHRNAQICASNYVIKKSKQTIETLWSNFNSFDDQVLENFFVHNYLNSILNCSNLMIKTSAIEQIGYFKENVTHYEDIDWFIRIGMQVKVAFSFKISLVIDETAGNRSDKIMMENRTFPDFNIYNEDAKRIKGLEKYLDLNRYSIALAYRMDNDIKNASLYQQQINLRNLSLKQQKLLKMSRLKLKSIKKTQELLGNLGLRLRSGN